MTKSGDISAIFKVFLLKIYGKLKKNVSYILSSIHSDGSGHNVFDDSIEVSINRIKK